MSPCYTIWVFYQWFHNLYSFLHPAKHGFLFILKNVLFREINDTEIPIKFSKKMIWKNQCLPTSCIWRWNVPYEKKLIQFKDRRKFRFFLKPEVSLFTHAQLTWERAWGRARKNLRCKQHFVRWFLLVNGFSRQLTIWWRQSPEVTFHFPSNARKIRQWALNERMFVFEVWTIDDREKSSSH